MQAIITHILPATNHRPTRIKACCARGSFIRSRTFDSNMEHEHIAAAHSLCARFIKQDGKEQTVWKNKFITGQLPSGDYAHVFITR